MCGFRNLLFEFFNDPYLEGDHFRDERTYSIFKDRREKNFIESFLSLQKESGMVCRRECLKQLFFKMHLRANTKKLEIAKYNPCKEIEDYTQDEIDVALKFENLLFPLYEKIGMINLLLSSLSEGEERSLNFNEEDSFPLSSSLMKRNKEKTFERNYFLVYSSPNNTLSHARECFYLIFSDSSSPEEKKILIERAEEYNLFLMSHTLSSNEERISFSFEGNFLLLKEKIEEWRHSLN